MSDQSEDRRRAAHVTVWVIGVVVFAGGYLASIGPATWLVATGWISDSTYDLLLDTVYAPLVWVDMNTEFFYENPVGIAYFNYVEWFDR